MVPSTRLSAEARRLSILRAAIPIFAKKGFNGTTTKMIAQSAGVSEALLYRHFPSKEVIYRELQDICCKGKEAISGSIKQLKPSTSTLVHAVYYLISAIFKGETHQHDDAVQHDDIHRLMAHSYLERGTFARIFIQENVKVWEPVFMECIEAAIDSGDMVRDWIKPKARLWFAHHIGVAIGFLNLPEEQVINYGFPMEEMLDQAVRFALRGMGLTDEALKTHYNPEMLALFTSGLSQLID